MQLAKLSARHGAFYVPAFRVKVSGRDVVRSLKVPVSQVEVEHQLSSMGRFSFTVVDCFDIKDREFLSVDRQPLLDLFSFGTEVDVAMGYGDHAGLPTLIRGMVTELRASFPSGSSPELVVTGYDKLFPLSLVTRSRTASTQHSQFVRTLASEYNLSSDVQDTESSERVGQNQVSDLQFLEDLAEENHFQFYLTSEGVLRFAAPRYTSDPVVTLDWGRTLLSFQPAANTANQVSRVEVYGWNEQSREEYIGRASAGQEASRNPRATTAGERLQQTLAQTAVLRVRVPVTSQQEADSRARALLSDNANKFLTGQGESIGIPELTIDSKVHLSGLGRGFSTDYFVEQVSHRLDSGGYRTSFSVKEASFWSQENN